MCVCAVVCELNFKSDDICRAHAAKIYAMTAIFMSIFYLGHLVLSYLGYWYMCGLGHIGTYYAVFVYLYVGTLADRDVAIARTVHFVVYVFRAQLRRNNRYCVLSMFIFLCYFL